MEMSVLNKTKKQQPYHNPSDEFPLVDWSIKNPALKKRLKQKTPQSNFAGLNPFSEIALFSTRNIDSKRRKRAQGQAAAFKSFLFLECIDCVLRLSSYHSIDRTWMKTGIF